MKTNKPWPKILFILICLLGLLVRTYRLREVPPGFFCDEAIRGLDAYLLFNTGQDSHRESFPLFFKVLGEYTPPLQTYSEILPIFLFGLNETAVRLTAAIYGTVSIILIYLLGTDLFSKKVGLISAFLLAITPWSFHYNRTGFEYSCYLTFFLASLVFGLKSLKNPKFLVPLGLFLALTFYSYNPAKLIVWIFLLGFLLINKKVIWANKKTSLLALMIFIIVSIPSINHLISGKGLIRFRQVSIFNENLSAEQSISKIIKNYLYHYSPNFLFITGDSNAPNNRHFSLGLKPLLITTFPFLIIGLWELLFGKKSPPTSRKMIILWALVYPSSGALTSIISTNRAIIGVGLFMVLTALGIERLILKLSRLKINPWPQIIIFFILGLNFLAFYQFYFKTYSQLAADFWGWQYGPREIMKYFLQTKDAYDDLYMSGEFNGSQVFLKFYDPENLCQEKCKIGDFWRNPQIRDSSRRQLFSLSPEYLENSGFKNQFLSKQGIYYPNGEIAFLIGELSSLENEP